MNDKRLLFAVLLFATLSAPSECLSPGWSTASVLTRSADRVVTGDVNGDGKPDVIGHTAAAIFVALNNGSGAFTTATEVHSGAIAGPVVTGDFTGDAKLDLAFGTSGSLVVRPGVGNGTFGTAIASAITVTTTGVLAAQVDAGATLDLLVYDATLARLVRYTNNGSGQFAQASQTVISAGAAAFTAADFDGNGRTDVVVAYGGSASWDLFFADANGAFGAPVAVGGRAGVLALRTADLDASGRPDLLAAAPDGLAALRNQGSGTFGSPILFADQRVSGVEVADVTGDGVPDAIITYSACYFRVGTGAGDGTFASTYLGYHSWADSCSSSPVHAAVADFDADGRNDVVLATHNQEEEKIHFFRNRCGDSEMTATAPRLATVGDDVFVTVSILTPWYVGRGFPVTGTVSIRKNGQTLATHTGSSSPTIRVPGLTLGTHELIAHYEGSDYFEPNQSAPVTVNVVNARTVTVLEISSSTVEYPNAPRIRATVTLPGGGTPPGRIRIGIDGGWAEGNAPQFDYPLFSTNFGIGRHTVTALYLGDENQPASSATGTYTIVRQRPNPYSSRNTAVAGEPQQTTIWMVINSGLYDAHAIPSGRVSIGNDHGSWSAATLTPPARSVDLTVPALPAGRYSLLIRYAGDDSFTDVEKGVPWVVFPATGESIDARSNSFSSAIEVTWRSSKPMLRRRTPNGSWQTIANASPYQPKLDYDFPAETVLLYRMEAADGSYGPTDVGMEFGFTDDVLGPKLRVKAIHLQEIVRATNLLRAAAGLTPFSATPFAPGKRITVTSILSLRTAINEARVALGAYPFVFTNTPAARQPVRAADIQELREAIR